MYVDNYNGILSGRKLKGKVLTVGVMLTTLYYPVTTATCETKQPYSLYLCENSNVRRLIGEKIVDREYNNKKAMGT